MKRIDHVPVVLGVLLAVAGLLVSTFVAAPAAAAASTVAVSGTVSLGTLGNHPGDLVRVTWERYDGFNWVSGPQFGVDTDASGHYSLDLEPGDYRLRLSPYSSTYQPQYWGGRSATNLADRLTVSTTPLSGIDAVLPVKGSISGHVSLGTSSTAAGAGQVLVSFSVCYEDGCVSSVPTTVLTDASGNYSFVGLYGGTYTLAFTYLGGAAYQSPGNLVVNINNSVQVLSGQNATMPIASSISGHVYLGSTSLPAPAGSVTVTAKYNPTGSNWISVSTSTDSSGAYSLLGLTDGYYQLFFDYTGPGGFADQYWSNTIFPSVASSIALARTAAIHDATLAMGGQVGGLVSNSAGAPLSGIEVVAYTLDPQTHSLFEVSRSTTGTDGRYHFTSLPSASYEFDYLFVGEIGPQVQYVGSRLGTDPLHPENAAPVAVTSGSSRSDVNQVLYQPSIISDRVTCSSCDLVALSSSIYVALQRNGGTTGAPSWGDFRTTNVSPAYGDSHAALYEFRPLPPGQYRLRVYLNGVPGAGWSPPVNLADGGSLSVPLTLVVSAASALVPGSLVKSSGAPYIYLWTGEVLLPVWTLEAVSALGLPTSFSTVPPSTIADLGVSTTALGSIFRCDSAIWLAAGGQLVQTDAGSVGSLPILNLPAGLCAKLVKTVPPVPSTVFFKSPADPTVYLLDAGTKRPILSGASLVRLAGTDPIVILTMNAPFVNSIPPGPDVIDAGMLVKSSSASTIYLADGAGGLLPITTFDSVSDLGLSTAFVAVSPATIASMTVSASSLRNVVTCASATWVAANGRLSAVDPSAVSGLPSSALATSLCAVIPKTSNVAPAVTLIKSPSVPTVYLLENGAKRAILTGASLGRLVGGNPIVILTANSAFVASIPSGADVLDAGMLVKSSSTPTIYVVDGANGLIPLASMDSVSSLGLATTFTTVSSATIGAMTIASAPLSGLVTCAGSTWIAAGGQRHAISGTLVAGLLASSLPASLCAVIPVGAALVSPVFIKGSAPTVYLLTGGQKRPIVNGAVLGAVAAGNPIVISTVSDYFASGIPTGPEPVVAGMLVKSPSAATIYLVDGASGLLPISSFESVSDIGLSTAFTVIAQSTISSLTVAEAPLSSLVICGPDTWLAANGKLWKMMSGVVGSLAASSLPTSLCNVLPKSSTMLSAAVFVKSPAAPTVYLLDNGTKRAIGSGATLASLASPGPIVILTLNGAFLGSVPSGAAIA